MMMDGGMWLVMCGVMWLMVMEGMDGLIGMLVLWMEAWLHSTIGCVAPERWHYGTMGVGGAMEEVAPWHYRDGATMEEVALWHWDTPWRRWHHGGGGAMVATLPCCLHLGSISPAPKNYELKMCFLQNL